MHGTQGLKKMNNYFKSCIAQRVIQELISGGTFGCNFGSVYALLYALNFVIIQELIHFIVCKCKHFIYNVFYY